MRQEEENRPMTLSQTHIALLRKIAERRKEDYARLPSECLELQKAGYVTIASADLSEMAAEITDKGRKALADAQWGEADPNGPFHARSNDEWPEADA
jgi:hypothetical protein